MLYTKHHHSMNITTSTDAVVTLRSLYEYCYHDKPVKTCYSNEHTYIENYVGLQKVEIHVHAAKLDHNVRALRKTRF